MNLTRCKTSSSSSSSSSFQTGLEKGNGINLKKITQDRVLESLRCPLCRKTFDHHTLFLNDLYSHLIDNYKFDKNYFISEIECRICKFSFDTSEELIKHVMEHAKTKFPFNASSIDERQILTQQKDGMGNEDGKPACLICGKVISTKYSMKRHMDTHTGEKKFTCHHCGKQYAQDSGLQRHVTVIHEGIRRYKCPICSKVFDSNGELKSHQDSHSDPRPFQCDQCGRTFIHQKHLYHHRKYHHTANGMRRLCKVCNRHFSSPSVLKRHHKAIHLGLKEFQCHVCSAQLSTKHYLQEHLKLHSDERSEVCKFCGKTFQMTGNLRQHLKTHMRKSQICYVCGKGFTRKCHLLIHLGSHKEIEHLECEYCQKGFILKSDLEKHIKREHG